MRLEPRLSLAVEPGDQAGCSVATLADIAFIGACAASKPENCDGCGAVHTVRISTRQPMALIQHPAAVQLAYFGSALAVARSGLDGSGILLVGAVGEAGPLGLRAGAAYTLSFSVDASSPIYTMRHRLSTATLLPEDNFGTAAALSPDVRTLATHHSYQSAVQLFHIHSHARSLLTAPPTASLPLPLPLPPPRTHAPSEQATLAVLGARGPQFLPAGVQTMDSAGAAYVFEVATGQLLARLRPVDMTSGLPQLGWCAPTLLYPASQLHATLTHPSPHSHTHPPTHTPIPTLTHLSLRSHTQPHISMCSFPQLLVWRLRRRGRWSHRRRRAALTPALRTQDQPRGRHGLSCATLGSQRQE